jgi:myosin heavy subunit
MPSGVGAQWWRFTRRCGCFFRLRQPHRPSDNLAQYGEISEYYIVGTLQLRFRDNVIYTFVGDILIALNPYKPIDLYTEHFTQR